MIEHWPRPGAFVDEPAESPVIPVPAALGAAGFFFPIVMLWIGFGTVLVMLLVAGAFAEFFETLLWLVIAHVMAFPAGLIFFVFVTIASLPVWGLWVAIRRSLDAKLDDAHLAAHAGATLGFILPLAYIELRSEGLTSAGETFVFALLTCVATPLGQYAGAWSQWPLRERKKLRDKWQFGIRQLLVATGWLAAALAVMKLTGLLTPVHLTTLAVWLVYQWATARGVFGICRWRMRKQRERGGGGGRE